MNFVHIADMHFDIPFTTLNQKDLGNSRRLDQREAFKKIIEYIKTNQIDYFFICGDLYEHEYVKQSTIEFINHLFKEIPHTKVYIVPGNHDPKIKNSYYTKYKWAQNVHIFGENIEKISEDKVDIYGFGFENFYMKNTKIDKVRMESPEKINILLTHAQLDSINDEEKMYNPISKKQLENLNFDYIALGHIHKPWYQEKENQNIIYPGSPISLGFDELGSHGMIVGEISEDKKLQIAFVPVDKKEFIELKLPVDEILSKEQLIEMINSVNIKENAYYKIILVGKRNFEINTIDIVKYVNIKNIIKIKNETKMKIDLEKLAREETLRGIFVKNLLAHKTNENEENILRAIEIGLEAME